MKYNDFLELVKSRRTIRKFKSDPIPDTDVDKVIEAARWAPSGFNSQPWEFAVVNDPATRKTVLKHLLEHMPSPSVKGMPKAPVFIFVFGDARVRPFGPPPVRENDRNWQFVFEASLSCAFDHMHLAAASLGLGAMWVTASRIPPVGKSVKEVLGIPDHLELYQMMALGYPDMTPPAKKMRPKESVVHYNVCRPEDYRSKEDIEIYFK
jgi:nitroreductase